MADLDYIHLGHGTHYSREEGMCLMEAVSYIAGEPHTDSPECACPVLAAFGRAWNDGLDDEARQRLLRPFIRRLIGTRSTPEVEERRAYMATDWLVRVAAPTWLRAAGLGSAAGSLEALAPLDSAEVCRDAMPAVISAQRAALVARHAAPAFAAVDAWDAVRASAVDAAWGVARASAVEAAYTAREAVDVVDWAVGVADATGVDLQQHVEQLQASAVELFERMIEVAA